LRPLGVLLSTGPSGVGKTYPVERIGELISRTLHQAFARFNMNEYKEPHGLARCVPEEDFALDNHHHWSYTRLILSQQTVAVHLLEPERRARRQ
jgi:hypothetical protein